MAISMNPETEEEVQQVAHKNHINQLLDIKPVSDVEKKSLQYHQAIIRGRHPRSYRRKDTASLWKFVSTSSERVKFCHAGRSVKDVASEEVDLPREADMGKWKNMASKIGMASKLARSPTARSPSSAANMSANNPRVQKRLNKMRREHDQLKKPIYHAKDRELLRERAKIQRRMNMETRLFGKYANRKLYKGSDPHHPDANDNSHITANKITQKDFITMKDTKIFYRSTVAFELVSDGTWLTVDHRQKQHVCARAADLGGQYVFRIINLKCPHDVSPIHYGDEIWLLVVPASRSREGLVLSTSCKQAVNLMDQQRKTKSNIQTFGKLDVCPARTHTEQGTHEVRMKQNQIYNARALAVGKLRIRKFSPDENQPVNAANGKEMCTNLAEISLDQDFYHVAVDEQTRDVVLRKFSPSNATPNTRGDMNVHSGVSSGGVWRLHLIEDGKADDELGSLEMCNGKTSQQLLYDARVQLQESAQSRDGETKRADKMKERDSLTPGTKFVPSIRAARQRADMEAEHNVIISGTQQMTKLKEGIRNPQAETTEEPLAEKGETKKKKRDKVPPLHTHGRRRRRSKRLETPPWSRGRSQTQDLSKSGDSIGGEAQQLSVPVRRRHRSFQKVLQKVVQKAGTFREYRRRSNRRHRLAKKTSQTERMAKYKKWLATQDKKAMSPCQRINYEMKNCTQEITKKLSEESELLKLPQNFLNGKQEKKKPPSVKPDEFWMQKLLSQDEKVVDFMTAMQKENKRKGDHSKKKKVTKRWKHIIKHKSNEL